ncbi:short chain dehydrogenase/reductase family protein [Daedaleopsis nitida]|nr:short chain dehydrogenase/reductase family protein [Daedaleopsis nitida]
MSSSSKIIIVTGANKGLGYSIVQLTAQRDPASTYVLCSRNIDSGKEAIQKLQEAGVTAKLDLLQLEVTNDEHIAAAVQYVQRTYGRLDVLINNAGILRNPRDDDDLSVIRQTYDELLSTNLTSVAVITYAFKPLLYKSADPKVINVTSGLGSIQNALTKKIGRAPAYGASKVGLNGLTIHMQVMENDRMKAPEGDSGSPSGLPRIRFYVVQPGVLKTAFSGFWALAKEPEAGAEVVYHLAVDDKKTYEGGSYWEFEEGSMRQVPW